MSDFDYDVIVIGTGFGGAVAACRLAEAGQRVLVLERGRRWTPATYPRGTDGAWLWSQERPWRASGWADIRTFSNMWVVAGAGVGGGSLIYANVSVEAKPDAFQRGWPPAISYAGLQPYYVRVGKMLEVQELPDDQFNARTRLMQEGAQACGWGARFRKLPLAVMFSKDYDGTQPDPRADRHSKKIVNIHGVEQGTCVHCGNCDIGCQVSAKNSLDLNYLAVAERHGAEIRPLHVVSKLEPLASGWRVPFDVIDEVRGSSTPGSASARRVILAAGSIGSTELLLRCRDEHRTMPKLSPRLGHGWAFNGDFVTPAFYPGRKISPSHGVTISAAIDLLDHSGANGQALFIEDGGIPNLALNLIRRSMQNMPRGRLQRMFKALAVTVTPDDPLDNMMPWFGQAMEPADGRLSLRRIWNKPWRRRLSMDWRYQRSEIVIAAMIEAHRRLSVATGGEPLVPPTWTAMRNIITPHPLGGCNMGITRANGVVDADGAVFDYPGLYVMDGAVIPRAIGLNPSRTIAALAERNVERLIATL